MESRVDKYSKAQRKAKQDDIENEIPNYDIDPDTAQALEEMDVQTNSRPSTACTNEAPAEETPMSKKLQLEDEFRSKTQNTTTSSFSAKMKPLVRPDSHGNDSNINMFSGTSEIQQSLPMASLEETGFSFAPKYPRLYTHRAALCEGSTSQQLPTSYQQDTMMPDAKPSNEESSAIGVTTSMKATTTSVASQAGDTTIDSSREEHARATEPQDQEDSVEGDASASEQASPCENKAFEAPVKSIEGIPRSAAAEKGEHDHMEEITLVNLDQTMGIQTDPTTPGQPRAKSPVPLTPRGGRPARIGKTKVPGRNTVKDTSSVPSSTTDAPSEQELFCMLMFSIEKNKAQRDQLISKGKAKIKTLVHFYKQMRQEKQDVEAALERSENAHVEAVNREHSLEAAIEIFETRFKKLKCYVSTMQTDHDALRANAADQIKALKDLRDSEREREVTMQQVQSTMQQTQSTLKHHKADLKAVRDASIQLLSQLGDVKKDLDQKSGQLQNERRKSHRLEGHVIDLQNTQRRHNQEAKEGNDRISKSLTDLAEHFCKFDLLLLQRPEIPQAFGECLDLVKDLHTRDQVTPADFGLVLNKVGLLQASVSEGVGVVNGLITRKTPDESLTSLRAAIAQLQASVDALSPGLTAVQSEREARIRAEARLAGKDETIETIQKARADAHSSVATFQEAAEAINKDSQRKVDAAGSESRRLEEINNVLNTKWARARSDLAATQRKLDGACRGKVALALVVANSVGRADQESEQRQALESSVRGLVDINSNHKQESTRLEAQVAQLEAGERSLNAVVKRVESERDELKADVCQHTQDLLAARESLKEKSREATILKTEVSSLQAQKQLHDQELHGLKVVSAELETAKRERESALVEVTGLKSKLFAVGNISAELAAMTERTRERNTELELLQSELSEARTMASKVSPLKESMETLSTEKSELEHRLEQATTKAADTCVLRSQNREKDVELSDLHNRLSEMNEVQEQLQKSLLVKQKLMQQLDAAKDRLAATEAELPSRDQLEIDLKQREAQLVELQQQVNKSGEVAAELEAIQVEYQLKDEQIVSLQREAQKSEQESREAQQALEGLPQHVVDLLMSHEPFCSSFQHRGRTTRNTPKTAENDHGEAEPGTEEADGFASQRPQRRVANRSATSQIGAGSHASAAGGHLSQADMPDDVDLVPDSQQIVLPNGSLGPSGQKEVLEQSSPLSDPHGDEDLEQDLQDVADGASHIDGRETQMRFSQGSHVKAPMHRNSSDKRPSSSMSVDLFRQHASGLSGSSRAQKLPHNMHSSPGLEPSETDHGHPELSQSSGSPIEELEIPETYKSPQTIDPAVLEPSPRRLRDGTQLGVRLTPLPESSADPRNLTTPARVYERHQPNSAAKRSAQDEPEHPSESKKQRLKRRADRLAPRPTIRSSSFSNPDSQPSTSGPAARNGGSVIGTSAPTPGKTQRSTKSTRKTTQTNKYAARFTD